jgi:hypothetical protein
MGFWEVLLIVGVLLDKLTITQAFGLWVLGYVVAVVVGVALLADNG